MLFGEHLVVVRGGGDLATGVVYRLRKAGFPVLVLELAAPLAIRLPVSVSSAVSEDRVMVEDLEAIRVDDVASVAAVARSGAVPVLVSPSLPQMTWQPSVVVDARLAKRNIDTTIGDAPLVVALGPGFTAGDDCDVVVETMRGHSLGRTIWDGPAIPNTGNPGLIGGKTSERVIRAARDGVLNWTVAIAETVSADQVIGDIGGDPIQTRINGVVRGLLPSGYTVETRWKVADIDPRADASACFEISDKSLAVGGGVLEAVLTWLDSTS